jgi:hypothetical protein
LVAATIASTASILSKIAHDILHRINALNLNDVASYFTKDDDEIDPYFVCDGVSVDAFNAYVGTGEFAL